MIMDNSYFQILRGGTHTTFQDNGFFNSQHLGITTGGAMDHDLFTLSNKIINNHLNTPVLEFCLQGPALKLINGSSRVVISGNVVFDIIRSSKTFEGVPYQSYLLNDGDVIDVKSTVKSNYGYLSIEGGFKIKKNYGGFDTLVNIKIDTNNGKKLINNQKIFINNRGGDKNSKINFNNNVLNKYIRVIPGPQMNYFFPKVIKNFLNNPFIISNTSNRMGIRLVGNICKAIKSHNIASEGIVKGSIQVPGDGNPIVLMNDHPTIGGYPKIATVILSDLSKIAQLPSGSKVLFKKILISESELLYKNKVNNFNKLLDDIKVH